MYIVRVIILKRVPVKAPKGKKLTNELLEECVKQLITKDKNSAENTKKSLRILLNSGVDYQLRTTFDKTVLTDSDIETIKKQLKEFGADLTKYVVQKTLTVNVSKDYKEKVKSLTQRSSDEQEF